MKIDIYNLNKENYSDINLNNIVVVITIMTT